MDNIEIIRKCLEQIPPATLDYNEWLKVGAAIKHEGGTCDMWDNWSMADRRHKPHDCMKRWEGLDKSFGSPVTIATIVQLCRNAGGVVPSEGVRVPAEEENEEIPMDRPVRYAAAVSAPSASEEKIIRKEWLEIEAMPEDSGASGADELSRYISALFEDDEYVGYVAGAIQTEPDAEGRRRWVPAGKGCYDDTARALKDAIRRCRGRLQGVVGDWEEECGAWIRFNPLDGKGVSDSNVTDYRYALVESDDIGIEEQYTIIKKLELPVAALVHSGRKSLHAIVRINAPDFKEYQRRVDKLYEICGKNGLAIDRKNRNPSRLSRMPGVTRNGVRQRLVAVNIGKPSWQEWMDWIAAQNDELPDFEDFAALWENIPPLADCLIEGVLRKGHKMLVSGPSKAGKSFLLLELAVAIAEGADWLGWKCRQGKVLYVNLELDRASCLNRIRDIYRAKGYDHPSGGIEVWNLRGQAVPMDKLAPKLIRRALKSNLAAVILDPIYKVITGDENAADQMAHFCNQFDKVCHELSCAFIYCHHHSKGSQGQKQAQDRASGSGVFARDPDALIDIVELDIGNDRREQVKYRYCVLALQELLDSRAPAWRERLEMEDQEKREALLEFARREVGSEADAINSAMLEKAGAMTGWRVGGILREFPTFQDRYTFFRYPLHEIGDGVDALLQDCHAVGEYVPMTPQERAEAGKKAAKRRREDADNETKMAFDAVMAADGAVTNKSLAGYLGIDESCAGKRLKKAGFVHPKGSNQVWITPKNETAAAIP